MATLAPPVGPTSRHLLPGSEYGDGSVGIRAGRHLGIDFQPAAPGGEDWINAIEDGTVEALFTEIPPGDKRNPLYPGHTGNVVAIRTANGRVWTYQHGKDFQVTLGQKIKAGDRLCRMWRSGTATGNHLHLGLRINGKFVDPEPVLRKAGAWPIGNTYYTASTPSASTPKEDTLSATEVNQIKAHITAEVNGLYDRLITAGGLSWAKVGHNGENLRSLLWEAAKGAQAGYVNTNAIKNTNTEVVKAIATVAQSQGLTPEQVSALIDATAKAASEGAEKGASEAVEAGVTVDITATTTANKKEA